MATAKPKPKPLDPKQLEALLAPVWADPADDGARLVAADALSERGDLWGEFIVLQVARASGNSTPMMRRRERELRAKLKSKKHFGAPFPAAGVRFDRGMPAAVMMGKAAAALAGHPAWSTVRALDLPTPMKRTELTSLLTGHSLGNLREVGTFRYAAELEALGEVPRAWVDVRLAFMPSAADLQLLPRLEQLFLNPGRADGALPGAVVPALAKLRALHVLGVELPEGVPLTSLRELKVMNPLPVQRLEGMRALKTLEVETLDDDPLLAGLPIESLTLSAHDPSVANIAALLDRLTQLKHLELRTFTDTRVALLNAARATGLETLTVNGSCYRGLRQTAVVVETWPDNVANLELAALPKGTIHTVRLVPAIKDPGSNTELPPTTEAVATLRAELAPMGIELEDAWW